MKKRMWAIVHLQNDNQLEIFETKERAVEVAKFYASKYMIVPCEVKVNIKNDKRK